MRLRVLLASLFLCLSPVRAQAIEEVAEDPEKEPAPAAAPASGGEDPEDREAEEDRAPRFRQVVLDPGHGGRDGGSKWHGALEKHLTLDLARRVKAELEKAGVPSVLTRGEDVFVSLEDRAAVANAKEDAIFVSIHFNGHLDNRFKGIETYYHPGSVAGRQLAASIQSALGSRIKTRDRGIKAIPYKVLRETSGTAVLIECGFISHRWEGQRCASPWYRQLLAEAIAEGILGYQ